MPVAAVRPLRRNLRPRVQRRRARGVSRIPSALLETVDAHKRYAAEQFVPLLSRRSRIFAGFVYAIKCARFLGGSC